MLSAWLKQGPRDVVVTRPISRGGLHPLFKIYSVISASSLPRVLSKTPNLNPSSIIHQQKEHHRDRRNHVAISARVCPLQSVSAHTILERPRSAIRPCPLKLTASSLHHSGYAPQPGYPHQYPPQYPPQYPQGQYPPQPPYGQPPNGQYPPQEMQYQPAPPPKEEKSHGCLYSW